jgi:hypothetical protein
MIEGSGSVFLTNGSGSGRPKNIWILRIRIRNPGGSGSFVISCTVQVRLAEEDEKRRREEEEGKYEVSRILEVKFPKNNKDKKEFLIRSVASVTGGQTEMSSTFADQ